MAGLLLAVSLESCAQGLSSLQLQLQSLLLVLQGAYCYSYRGHKDRILTVAWSPNGKYIASGSLDKTAQVWASSQSEHFQPYIYRGHTGGVQTVTWSPDSNRVASGSIDKTIQVWDALSGEHAALYWAYRCCEYCSVVTEWHLYCFWSADHTVRVWEVATGKQLYVYRGHNGSINSIVWSPDSTQIASGSTDKTCRSWTLRPEIIRIPIVAIPTR